MLSDSHQSGSMTTVSSDKSRKEVKADSVMKAQAWVSGISTLNPATSSTSYTGSTHQRLQSRWTTAPHGTDAQIAERGLDPVDHPMMSLMQLPVSKLQARSLTTPQAAPDDAMVEKTTVENTLNLPHLSADIVLGTPMKRFGSISASAGHLKTSAVSNHPSSTRVLHFTGNTGNGMGRTDYDPKGQYLKQLPQVQSIVERQSAKPSKLYETSQAGFYNMQQQTADVVDVHGSFYSAALRNDATDRTKDSAEIPSKSKSLTSALTVSSQSSVVDHTVAAPVSVNAGHMSSSQTSADGVSLSQNSTSLNELWFRFSRDYSVCSPHATDSGTTVNIGSTEGTESGVNDSNIQLLKYQSLEQSIVEQVAGEKSRDFTAGEKLQLRSLTNKLVSSDSLGHSLSAGIFVTNVPTGHHNLSPDTDCVPQQNTESSRSSHEAHANMEDKSPSESDEAGKLSSLSASVPVRHAWIVKDETLPVVPEDTTLDSVTSDFVSTSSVDDMGNVITRTTKRHLPNDSKLLRLQQKIAQQREKHQKVRRNEQRRKEHIVKMELALHECQKALKQETGDLKKTEHGRHPSSSQLQMTMSNTTLTTVTSNDSDLTLCSSSLQSDDHRLLNNSHLRSPFDTSGSCSCQQVQCGVNGIVNPKASEEAVVQKRHRSETAFKPKLREVKYTNSKATKSAPSVLSDVTASREQERRNAMSKHVSKKSALSSSSRRTHVVPETAALKKNTQDHRSLSRTNKPTAKTSPSKTNYVSRILAKTNKPFAMEHGMQSKAVQTTPRLQNGTVLYASTAVQCSDICSHFDELGVISLPVMSRGQRVRSSSSKIFSPDSSSDAEWRQHLKLKSLIKQPVRVDVPRELSVIDTKTSSLFIRIVIANLRTAFTVEDGIIKVNRNI